jgi:hypothetical protein
MLERFSHFISKRLRLYRSVINVDTVYKRIVTQVTEIALKITPQYALNVMQIYLFLLILPSRLISILSKLVGT